MLPRQAGECKQFPQHASQGICGSKEGGKVLVLQRQLPQHGVVEELAHAAQHVWVRGLGFAFGIRVLVVGFRV